MSDIMRPMSFEQLLNWTLTEHKKRGTVFGEHHPYHADSRYNRTIFERTLETPVGPAAGPHTQLAQNIVAAYYTGSRFFELKTVQVMDGAELSACVNKPCIKADDECYNCEWSTELYVPQAMEEYIKAWFLCKVIAKEFSLGSMDGFQFNISGPLPRGRRSGRRSGCRGRWGPRLQESRDYAFGHFVAHGAANRPVRPRVWFPCCPR